MERCAFMGVELGCAWTWGWVLVSGVGFFLGWLDGVGKSAVAMASYAGLLSEWGSVKSGESQRAEAEGSS